MSSVPPPLTPENPLPWEARQTRGAVEAFFDTLGLFFSRPMEAWARTRETGDLASPLLFGLIISWISFVGHRIVTRFVTVPVVLPGEIGRRLLLMDRPYGRAGFIASAIFAPIFILVALFIGAAILHACCLITGALSTSASGFEGSFRAVAYSQVASIASLIPAVGGLIAVVWWIFLAVMGVQRVHRTTQGRAIAAVLVPVIVCCGGIILIAALGAAFLLGRGR